MSETKELAIALAKAQGQIKAAKKTSENPAFTRGTKKSMYADIGEVIETIQKPASDNGLSVIFDYKLEGDTLFIMYILMHSSGEKYMGSPVPMFLRDKTVHGFGASNTFMRRQLLKSIYQIPEEDDDGNVASEKPEIQGRPNPPPSKQTTSSIKLTSEPITPTSIPSDLAQFIIPLGAFRGIALQDVAPDSLISTIDKAKMWLMNNPQDLKASSIQEFIDNGNKYLKQLGPVGTEIKPSRSSVPNLAPDGHP